MNKKANREYKDGMFRMLFNDEDKLRELYNAIKGTNHGAETKVSIRTLKKAIYLDLKNDLAFSIGNEFIVLIEHQSTISPICPYGWWNTSEEYWRNYWGDRSIKQQL